MAHERKRFYDRPVVSNERTLKSVPGIERNAERFDSCLICTAAQSGNLNCSERDKRGGGDKNPGDGDKLAAERNNGTPVAVIN